MQEKNKKRKKKSRKKKQEKTPHSYSLHPVFQGTTYFPKKTEFLQKIGEKKSGLGKNSFAYRNWEKQRKAGMARV
ncbi:hypothetical protein [Schinkia azotoformans]|uniref:hypothetical protein n=1 Tax=Schinkia azotoformans TaxID=1454 RepID=UPI002DBC2DA7|nr:hypothetical protein [Schinkia azotoformans]MEC1748280.1 hypothetical protein [Schinkia azotoformans]